MAVNWATIVVKLFRRISVVFSGTLFNVIALFWYIEEFKLIMVCYTENYVIPITDIGINTKILDIFRYTEHLYSN